MSSSILKETYLTKLDTCNAFYNIGDSGLNGIIFEFVACDISDTFNVIPTITPITTTNGFSDVSAVAYIEVASSTLNNLFYIYSPDFSSNVGFINNPSIQKTLEIGSLLYGINKDFNFNYVFSSAYIRRGTISGAGTQQISDDYVRYIAKTLFKVDNLTDLFSNESALVNGVISMDAPLNQTFNTNLSSISGSGHIIVDGSGNDIYFDTSSNVSNNTYINSCKDLVNGFLSISNTVRGQQFFVDLSGQQADDGNVSLLYIPFRSGDMLSLKITYKFGSSLTGLPFVDTVGNRSYKIVLICSS